MRIGPRYIIETVPASFKEPSKPECFRVIDNTTDTRMATCYNKRNAEKICAALNEVEPVLELSAARR